MERGHATLSRGRLTAATFASRAGCSGCRCARLTKTTASQRITAVEDDRTGSRACGGEGGGGGGGARIRVRTRHPIAAASNGHRTNRRLRLYFLLPLLPPPQGEHVRRGGIPAYVSSPSPGNKHSDTMKNAVPSFARAHIHTCMETTRSHPSISATRSRKKLCMLICRASHSPRFPFSGVHAGRSSGHEDAPCSALLFPPSRQ